VTISTLRQARRTPTFGTNPGVGLMPTRLLHAAGQAGASRVSAEREALQARGDGNCRAGARASRPPLRCSQRPHISGW
jgi:hypothetical protein